jgi:hypothetical protein
LDRAKLGDTDKLEGFRRLTRFVEAIERQGVAEVDFDKALAHERRISKEIGGRTVFDDRKRKVPTQLSLF